MFKCSRGEALHVGIIFILFEHVVGELFVDLFKFVMVLTLLTLFGFARNKIGCGV